MKKLIFVMLLMSAPVWGGDDLEKAETPSSRPTKRIELTEGVSIEQLDRNPLRKNPFRAMPMLTIPLGLKQIPLEITEQADLQSYYNLYCA